MANIRIFFDCNSQVGMGHFRRSLTLANELVKRGSAVELAPNPLTESRGDIPFSMKAPVDADCVVFDCADNAQDLIKEAEKNGDVTIALDYFGTALPDLAISVFEHGRSGVQGNRKSGFEYILIREDLRKEKETVGVAKKDQHAVVMLGGGDVKGQSAEVALTLAEQGYQVDLIFGPLAKACRKIDNPHVNVHHSPKNLAELMKGASLALTNGGGCLFEFCFLGTPTFVLPQTDAETRIAQCFLDRGVILGFGIDQLNDLFEMDTSTTGRGAAQLIDGRGAERIADEIEKMVRT